MKSVVIRVVLALLLSALAACGTQVAVQPTASNVTIAVQVESEPPAVGAETLIITLKDGSGAPIDGATLQVRGDMDHAGMMAVEREVRDSAGGSYQVPFEWTMGGGWIVTVTAQLPDNGGEISQKFEFFVEAVSKDSVVQHNAGMAQTAEATAEDH